jgi:hypothetical protein
MAEPHAEVAHRDPDVLARLGQARSASGRRHTNLCSRMDMAFTSACRGGICPGRAQIRTPPRRSDPVERFVGQFSLDHAPVVGVGPSVARHSDASKRG